MNRLRKAVGDYLAMRRGLGFKLVRYESGYRSSSRSWSENAARTSPSIWHWSGQHNITTTHPVSGQHDSASCGPSPGTGVRRIP